MVFDVGRDPRRMSSRSWERPAARTAGRPGYPPNAPRCPRNDERPWTPCRGFRRALRALLSGPGRFGAPKISECMYVCLEAGCPTLVPKGRCLRHARPRVSEGASLYRLYRTARWRQLRALVLADNPLCRDCLSRGRTIPATDVDHDVPHHGDVEIFWNRENLVGLCRSCHSRKTRAGE